MTVRELIAKLQECDPEAVIYSAVVCDDTECEEVDYAEQFKRWKNPARPKDRPLIDDRESTPRGYIYDGHALVLS